MCGFVGYFEPDNARREPDMHALVQRMAARIAYRGPDDAGSWVDAAAGIAIGHRRLSVIDLSAAGHQPMVSANGRYVIAYNGEVYNFAELRRELAARGIRFRSDSDTEVLLEACAAWGVEAAVKACIGMFAFALWDREARALTLVRDRLGIKPLYWGRVGGVTFFGSQPSAFFDHPEWRPEVDRAVLKSYLRHGYVPTPHSIYRGIAKLAPGTVATITDGDARTTCYWRLRDVAAAARDGRRAAPADGCAIAADIEALEALLRRAVGDRMIADVPLGAFLSGGIDSSTVVALMQAQSDRPVRSFSIGFDIAGYNEAEDAGRVAAHLGTDHTELYVQPRDAFEALPLLADWYDEPFADSSQIPTYLVSRMTRGHVTVALSGDGGDELFAGYNRYFWAEQLWRKIGPVPAPLRRAAAGAIAATPPALWDRFNACLPRRLRHPHAGNKAQKLAEMLRLDSRTELYRMLVSQWQSTDLVLEPQPELETLLSDTSVDAELDDYAETMQFLDTLTYLPDDILTKVDRASMAVSLEARVPLLDHRIVEFAWRLPRDLKIRNGDGKWILRQVLKKYVPDELVERPKMGFGVPIGHWLRGELRDWAEALLDEHTLRDQGYFDPGPIRAAWQAHLSGKAEMHYPLWVVLMFQAWHVRWMGAAGAPG